MNFGLIFVFRPQNRSKSTIFDEFEFNNGLDFLVVFKKFLTLTPLSEAAIDRVVGEVARVVTLYYDKGRIGWRD